MKKTLYLIISVIIISVLGTSCKTTEENYKAAYDTALQKKELGKDRDVSAFIERERRMREYTTVDGDSVKMLSQRVSMLDGNPADVKRYGVVVGNFKQVFNARSFRERVNAAENNTEAPAYVVKNSQNEYLVVYRGFETKSEAAAFLKDKNNFKISTATEEPWILEVTN